MNSNGISVLFCSLRELLAVARNEESFVVLDENLSV
jgi:hypothetical protein